MYNGSNEMLRPAKLELVEKQIKVVKTHKNADILKGISTTVV